MNINSGIKQAVILTIGIIMLGFCIKSGLESVISKDRKVIVKGLAEKEVASIYDPATAIEVYHNHPPHEPCGRNRRTPLENPTGGRWL